MMVQQNRNAIVSTLFLNNSPRFYLENLSIFPHKLSDYYPLFFSIYISKHYKKRRKKVHQTTNTKISSMHTLRQQQNTFQQKLKLNIESHGKL